MEIKLNEDTKKRLIIGAIILVLVIILMVVIISVVKNKDNVADNANKNESGYIDDVEPEKGNIPAPDINKLVQVTVD